MTIMFSGGSLRGPRREHSRTTAGLRWGEAAARAVLRTAFSVFGLLFADEGMCGIYLRRLRGSHQRCEPPKITPLRGAAANCAVLQNRKIHMRQPNPRQKRFRTKGGRGDEALRIGDLLIASKVPKASDSA